MRMPSLDVSSTASQGLSAELRGHASELADSTGVVVADADARLQAASDQSLTMVAGMSVGFALGLLTGGSNRFLVAAALAPAGLIIATLLERAGGTASRRGARAR